MIRTQIQFEEQQYELIREIAHRKRISVSEAVRRLVTLGLREGLAGEQENGAKLLLDLAGVGSSGLGDLGRNHDDHLAEDLGT